MEILVGCTSCQGRRRSLLLYLGIGLCQWGMEEVVGHSCPRCGGRHPFLCTLGGLRLVNGKWRMEQVIHHTFPGVRCQGPFNPVMGRGFEGNGRCRMEQVTWKYVECPLPEVLKHNKRTSAVQNMVIIPSFLKGRYRDGVTLSNF